MPFNYVKKPRCVDCGRIVRSDSKTYQGDLCEGCKFIRTISNKKKWEAKNKDHRNARHMKKPLPDKQHSKSTLDGAMDRAIHKAIMTYGLSASISDAIGRKMEVVASAVINRAETAARLEARKTTYQILIHLGAQALLPKNNLSRLRTKTVRDIEKVLGQKVK